MSDFNRRIAGLKSPEAIQTFLDGVAYNPEEGWYRCPLQVAQDKIGHCFEGAVFAAAALRRLGYDPLILNMFPEPGTDDEHLVAVYRRNGGWGAVGQSNFVGLRAREPIHRNIRELVLSYFESYYNVKRQKTLRTYTRPLDLSRYDKLDWINKSETMNVIDKKLDELPRTALLTKKMIAELHLVDQRAYEAGLQGANPAGLYRP
jgi:hypothetical protein